MSEIFYITIRKAAAIVRAAGVPCADGAPRKWMRLHPPLGRKIAGHVVLRAEVPHLLLAGLTLSEIAERLADQSAAGAVAAEHQRPSDEGIGLSNAA